MNYSKPTIKDDKKDGAPITSNFSPPPVKTGEYKRNTVESDKKNGSKQKN